MAAHRSGCETPAGIDTTILAETLRADSVLIEPGAPFFAGETPPTEYLPAGLFLDSRGTHLPKGSI